MSRESLYSPKAQEQHEDMDWSEVELEEHALLETLQESMGVGVLDGEDWMMIDVDSEHGYLDEFIMELEHEVSMKEAIRLPWRRQSGEDVDDLDYDWLVVDCDDQEDPPEIACRVMKETETFIEHLSQLTGEQNRHAVSSQEIPNMQQLLSPLDSLVCRFKNLYDEFGYPACDDQTWNGNIDLIKNCIVGIKGGAGSRKRKSLKMSGGWLKGRRIQVESSGRRKSWKLARRSLLVVEAPNTSPQKEEGREVDCVCELAQVDKLEMQVTKLRDSLNRQQQDIADTAEKKAAICQQDISDKSKSGNGYWAKDFLVSGTASLQDTHDVQQLHHQLEELQVHEDPLQQPGHMVHEDIGHVKDKPGKDKYLYNLIVSVTGKEVATGGQGGHGGGQVGVVHHEGGASDSLWDYEGVAGQAGQDAAPDLEDPQEGGDEVQEGEGGSTGQGWDQGPQPQPQSQLHIGKDTAPDADQVQGQEQPKGLQGEGEPAGGVQVQGGEGGDRDVHDGGGGVLAQVRSGFGGERMKRAYWRKKLVPDGLVQRRIFEFSTQPNDGRNSGMVGRNLECTNSDRKRKWTR